MSKILEPLLLISLCLITIPFLAHYLKNIFFNSSSKIYFLENVIYKIAQIDPKEEMGWKSYAKALLYFNLCGFIALFVILIFQHSLPLNPQNLLNVEPLLALNIAVSFVTNTNWQAYAGENTLSYLTQMSGITVQNFVSAATGNAVVLALIRGITRKSTTTIGNFWSDLVRTVVYLLLPLSIIFSLLLVSQGVIQNFNSYVQVETLSGDTQTLPMGPAASQIAIKQLGSNGGGFFHANSAHPYENPTLLSNFLELFAIILIPVTTIYMYGLIIQSKKQVYVIYAVISTLWLIGFTIAQLSEHTFNPVLEVYPVLEGKETRFGINNSILWSNLTTSTSNGSVNAMQSSLSPLASGISMFNMMIGETIYGGVGVGLCSLFMFIFLTVFLAGLMIGRTPEYLGKKIEKNEVQWVMLAVLSPSILILIGAAVTSFLPMALESLSHAGPHGLTEILYTYTSTATNNGSSFASFKANTDFYNLLLAIVMLLGRLAILIPSLAIAGGLAQKAKINHSLGTFATDQFLFGILLFSIILIAALTFFPIFSLGPIAEQILMLQKRTF